MISTDDLAFFDVVANAPTLAEAARRLNVTPPAVTQRLRALETRVGVRLVERAAQGLSLTDEGELIASEGAAIISAIENLAELVASRTAQVRGHLRVAAPHGFGRHHIAPVVKTFVERYPETSVTLELSDSPVRQMSESWDMVIHIGSLPESDRLVTTLAPNRRILCASPSYLKRSGRPASPSDLASQKCLAIRENNEDVTLWRFVHTKLGKETVRIKPFMSSNDGEVVRAWALAGLGILLRSEWDVAEDLREGRLEEVLPSWSVPSADVVALLHTRNGRSGRTNAFLQLVRESLTPPSWRL